MFKRCGTLLVFVSDPVFFLAHLQSCGANFCSFQKQTDGTKHTAGMRCKCSRHDFVYFMSIILYPINVEISALDLGEIYMAIVLYGGPLFSQKRLITIAVTQTWTPVLSPPATAPPPPPLSTHTLPMMQAHSLS